MKSSDTNIPGLLFVAFVVLKLCGVINWSWWWVTSPIWGMVIIFLIIVCFAYLLVWIKEKLYWRKRKKDSKNYRYENFKSEIKRFGENQLRTMWLKSQDAWKTDKAKEFGEFLKRYKKETNV